MKEKNVIEKLLELPEEKLDRLIEKIAANEADKLMWKLQELLFEKLPEKCRIQQLKTFIHRVEVNLQNIERHGKCLFCEDTE